MKKFIIAIGLILLCNCTITRFTSLSDFDKVEYESRSFDSTVTCVYYGDYDYIWDDYNYFVFQADSLTGSQLKTKETFSIEPPFSVEVDAKMNYTNLALYCPLWLMNVEDSGGMIVREIDIVEVTDESVILSAHYGDTGYGSQKVNRKFIRNITPNEWHNYKVKVYDNRAIWYIDNKRRFTVYKDWGGREYYFWISIIMSTKYQNSELPKEARMDVRNIKAKKSNFKIKKITIK